jgi:hypothetical protein
VMVNCHYCHSHIKGKGRSVFNKSTGKEEPACSRCYRELYGRRAMMGQSERRLRA